jgi:hypothetical protein
VGVEPVENEYPGRRRIFLDNIPHEICEIFFGPGVSDMGFDNFSGSDLESRQQRLRAVPDIFELQLGLLSGFGQFVRVCSFESLNARFFIKADNTDILLKS